MKVISTIRNHGFAGLTWSTRKRDGSGLGFFTKIVCHNGNGNRNGNKNLFVFHISRNRAEGSMKIIKIKTFTKINNNNHY